MSEERFNHLEAQISALQQDMTVVQQDMTVMKQDMTAIKQDMTAMKQNVDALREDMTAIRQRVDSSEGTILVAVREGFNSLRNYLDDLNYEVADNARATRLLKRRVSRLERKDNE
jgi:chromosome segregation ATPase